MTDPILELLPAAAVFHLGMYRNEETAMPVEYYNKLSDAKPVDFCSDRRSHVGDGWLSSPSHRSHQGMGRPTHRHPVTDCIRGRDIRVAASYPDIPFLYLRNHPILEFTEIHRPRFGRCR